MATEPVPGFAGLLRHLRTAALLTQEELAEAARLSPRSVSDLERGINRTARKDTAMLLGGALGLTEPVRSLFVAAALGLVPAAQVLAAMQEQATPAAPAVIPRQLPAGAGFFAGREAELKQLDALLGQIGGEGGAMVISAVAGMAGVGKTALAVHWTRRVADRFPDGQLYVNLRGYDQEGAAVTPEEVTGWFLVALGVPAVQIPADAQARSGLYRSVLAGRRVLIVLDNARDAAQVRPLLPGSAGCLVVVTSRSSLAGLAAAEGARPLRLGPLGAAEAVRLLAARLGPERVAPEPEAVTELADRCGHLPLALAVMAARAAEDPGLPLGALAGQLAGAAGAEAAAAGASASRLSRMMDDVTAGRHSEHPDGAPVDAAKSVPVAARAAAIDAAQARPLTWKTVVKRALAVAAAGAAIYLVLPSLIAVLGAWPRLSTLNPVWFTVALAAELVSFTCNFALQRLALRTRGWFAVVTAGLAGNAVTDSLPGGDAAGAAVQFSMLTAAGLDTDTAVGGLTAFSLLGVGGLLALPLFALPTILGGAAVSPGLVHTALLGIAGFVLFAIFGIILLRTDRPLASLGRAAQSVWNRVTRDRRPVTGLDQRLVAERDTVRAVLGRKWWQAVLLTAGRLGLDYGCLLAALRATGAGPRPSLVLLAYAAAGIIALFPLTPGGLGIVEASLSGLLILAGVRPAYAVLATLAYRIASYWLPLLAGPPAYLLFRHRYGQPVPRRAMPGTADQPSAGG